ncbi:MAG: histidine triad nucleotide-binding protein [Thermogemmatispora sp.]|jgi:histidine triad (HIT) family protein|uniref:Histidine triad nucleotide-binding protein n=2 Tax=Thermogemmatispora TaxID=768669 RepID=A0A328VGJ0_9CHLR|nr:MULTISPECIES: histidine triad nucleotide-binding protein [Thermogemmatispora]MBE3565763.1 histidine triad nucleotide-binding protein [Thermogemmatispora sp.]RAQ96069.1 histidine triad nucleotide-binding protein [Thermogemmatispora tikiterensis]GER82350.1 histidine triad nucleotide-binding protein [Thermogemmatispora aurantia]
MQDCLFCKIANGEIPSKILYQDAEVVAFADINPQAPHHVLLIPRRHLASMKEVTEQDGALLAHLFVVANKLAQDFGLSERGFRFVTNVGPDAGQSVFHLHFHLLGGRPFGWPPG